MPPEGQPLTSEHVLRIRNWILQGARFPADETPERDPRQHWAFQQPKRPPVPDKPLKGDWVNNPIDAFVAQKHIEHELAPQSDAAKSALLRRVTIDLTGIPPTPMRGTVTADANSMELG